MYSITWNGAAVKMSQRVCFMHKGNQLFGVVAGFNANFTNLLVVVDSLSY